MDTHENKETVDTEEKVTTPTAVETKPVHTVQADSQLSNVRKYFLYILVGGLIVSAVVSILAVLIGEFNTFIWRSLGTTMSMVFHSLVALFLVSVSTDSHQKGNDFIVNVLIGITIASFATSILSIWEILTGRIIGDLYAVYTYTFFFAILIQALRMATRADKITSTLTTVSTVVSVLLYLMLYPTIFTHYPDTLPDFYYRLLSAVAILLGTTSVLTAIFHKLYISKHPEPKPAADAPSVPHRSNVLNVVLAIVIVVFGVPILMSILISSMVSHY